MLGSSDGVLARFTRDLTAAARSGRLDPVRCRDVELDRVVDILLRRDKNNPVLLGEAGVGKTAIAEGLAQRLAAGTVPLALREARVLSLDHVGLLSGTIYRGQYEERIRGLVEEVSRLGRETVLFIDELHNLVGQGTAVGVAMDAGNMLKPALTRGDFRVLGATTQSEYDRWIKADPALERRFQPVWVRELGSDETLDILHSRRELLERHHFVAIADSALLAAVRLTDLFQQDRRRPDRALDVLDEACAHAHAVAVYGAETEALIRRAKAAELRGFGFAEDAAPDAADAGRDARAEPGDEGAEPAEGTDSVERLARDGFAVLERLGAEIEAMFGDPGLEGDDWAADRGRAAESPRRSRPEAAGGASATADARARDGAPRRVSRAELHVELRRRLMEAGIVVRGADVARVVSLISGKRVTWVD